MDRGRPGILGHQGPFLAGPWEVPRSRGTHDARCPRSERRRSPPRGGRRLSPAAQEHRDFPSTPPPAESREDAELGLPSGGHRPGHGQSGRLWTKFRVATGGGVRKAKPWLVGFPIGQHSGPRSIGRSPIHPPHLLGPHSARPSRLRSDPASGSPQGPAAAAPLGKQVLSRTLVSDAPAEPRAAPRSRWSGAAPASPRRSCPCPACPRCRRIPPGPARAASASGHPP